MIQVQSSQIQHQFPLYPLTNAPLFQKISHTKSPVHRGQMQSHADSTGDAANLHANNKSSSIFSSFLSLFSVSSSAASSSSSSTNVSSSTHVRIHPHEPSTPSYPGPYHVGITHFESSTSTSSTGSATENSITSVSDTTTTEQLKVEEGGVYATLFYPCELSSLHQQQRPSTADDSKRLHRSKWLSSHGPQHFYTEGYSKIFLGKFLPSFLSTSIIDLALGRIHIPAIKKTNIIQDDKKFPLMIFCHGLMGSSVMYSSLCGSFASRYYNCTTLLMQSHVFNIVTHSKKKQRFYCCKH